MDNAVFREENARRHRRRRRQALGLVLAVLILVGLGTIATSVVGLVGSLFDDTDLMKDFENRLQIMVMFDPLPFDSLEQADQIMLREVGIWGALYGELETSGSLDAYERDPETDCIILPTLEVDATLTKLVGPGFSVTHESFEDDGMTFTYLEDKQGYLIPITGQQGRYTPTVVKLTRGGGKMRVTVGYIPVSSPADDFMGATTATEPVKYMDYIFEKTDSVWYLTALEESEMQPVNAVASDTADQPDAVDSSIAPEQQLQGAANDGVVSSVPTSDASAQTDESAAAEPASEESSDEAA